MYLHIEGVEGTSRHRGYRGCIDVLSYTWGLARSRRPEGKPPGQITTGNALSLEKMIGIDSAALMDFCAAGTIVPCVTLSIVPTVSRREVQQKYAEITLRDVAIKSITTSGAIENDGIRERLELRFNKLRFDYFAPVSADTSAPGAAVNRSAFEYDFATQAAPPA